MADARVVANMAPLSPAPIGADGVLAAGQAQSARAAAAAFIASMDGRRWGTTQKVPMPFCWADLEPPFPIAPYIPGPGATGYAAAPVPPTLAK